VGAVVEALEEATVEERDAAEERLESRGVFELFRVAPELVTMWSSLRWPSRASRKRRLAFSPGGSISVLSVAKKRFCRMAV